jgi:NAD(P)-dependent dehydrogenase (short-subunit alcohol dehydrogenase family)
VPRRSRGARREPGIPALHFTAGRMSNPDQQRAFTNQHLPTHQLSRSTWDMLLAVNLTATFLGVRACIDDLMHQGAVVITSAAHALIWLPEPACAAAKGGLAALTQQLAAEYGPTVRVNAVLP